MFDLRLAERFRHAHAEDTRNQSEMALQERMASFQTLAACGRFARTVNGSVAPYAGAAWGREFDGKARTASNGHAIDAPNLRDDTGVGELG